VHDLHFNVFGKLIAVAGQRGAWTPFFLGTEGKRRPADFIVPNDLEASEIGQYLADLFHEAATPANHQVVRLYPSP